MLEGMLALIEAKGIAGMTMRQKVSACAAEIAKLPYSGNSQPGAAIERLDVPPVKHHFSDGIYAREMLIPAGMLLIGKIHKYPQLNIMSQGDMSVLTEDGIRRVQAPYHIKSPAGTQRIAFAWADTVWTTILATTETDPAKIEEHFVVDNDDVYAVFLRGITDQRDAQCLLA
jgi:hypothetical protein